MPASSSAARAVATAGNSARKRSVNNMTLRMPRSARSSPNSRVTPAPNRMLAVANSTAYSFVMILLASKPPGSLRGRSGVETTPARPAPPPDIHAVALSEAPVGVHVDLVDGYLRKRCGELPFCVIAQAAGGPGVENDALHSANRGRVLDRSVQKDEFVRAQQHLRQFRPSVAFGFAAGPLDKARGQVDLFRRRVAVQRPAVKARGSSPLFPARPSAFAAKLAACLRIHRLFRRNNCCSGVVVAWRCGVCCLASGKS